MRPAARVRVFPAWLLAAVLAAGLAAGCSTEAPPPPPVVRKPAPKAEASQPASQKGADPQKKAETVALYDSRGKRDPFVSFIREEPQLRAKDLAALPPLQRYELGELKVVGILWTKKGAKALVEDAEGKGYSVVAGSRIGRSGGVVSRITEKEVFVREEYVGVRGEKVVRENAMQLTKAGGN